MYTYSTPSVEEQRNRDDALNTIVYKPGFDDDYLFEVFKAKLKACDNELEGLQAAYNIRGTAKEFEDVKSLHLAIKVAYIKKFPNASDFMIHLLESVLIRNITLIPCKDKEIHISRIYNGFNCD